MRDIRRQLAAPAALLVAVLFSAGCGGGGGGGSFAPAPLAVFTSTLPDGINGTAYSQTLTATGGTPPYMWSLASGSGPLPGGVMLASSGVLSGTPTQTGTFSLTVQVRDSAAGTATRALSLRISNLLTITTASPLPSGSKNVPYATPIAATGGVGSYTWTLEGITLPPGLTLTSSTPNASVAGTPSVVGVFTFVLDVTDQSNPPQKASRFLELTVNGIPGRNDSIATATPLHNGLQMASISPYGDPPSSVNPDQDFYRVNVAAGGTVTIDIRARRELPTFIDSVLEIQDANGNRLNTCRPLGSAGLFTQPCMNDDLTGTLDSGLEFQNPTTAASVTIFVRVLDFRGDARPDLIYRIFISGSL
ncbi:MAG: Ig domain-containing protein [Candidatus Acidiferrales bacterium]